VVWGERWRRWRRRKGNRRRYIDAPFFILTQFARDSARVNSLNIKFKLSVNNDEQQQSEEGFLYLLVAAKSIVGIN
jgi:hypothetical protein